jgi:3-deoxy-7-phosphoheptulonate synthase
MVDMSHANSSKQFRQQLNVTADISRQLESGRSEIMGVMIESNLIEGRQDIGTGRGLTYGQSVTDACIGWDDSVACLERLANAVAKGNGSSTRRAELDGNDQDTGGG